MQVPEVGETRVAAPAESILSMVVPVVATCHTNSLICHRIAHDAIAVAERAIHRHPARSESLQSRALTCSQRCASEARREAKRSAISPWPWSERERRARDAVCQMRARWRPRGPMRFITVHYCEFPKNTALQTEPCHEGCVGSLKRSLPIFWPLLIFRGPCPLLQV